MTTILPFIIGFVITYNWLRGIEYMQKNHPDYKGEDFLGEDIDTK